MTNGTPINVDDLQLSSADAVDYAAAAREYAEDSKRRGTPCRLTPDVKYNGKGSWIICKDGDDRCEPDYTALLDEIADLRKQIKG